MPGELFIRNMENQKTSNGIQDSSNIFGPDNNITFRLAVNRINPQFPYDQDFQQQGFYTPGEEISTQPDFLRYEIE